MKTPAISGDAFRELAQGWEDGFGLDKIATSRTSTESRMIHQLKHRRSALLLSVGLLTAVAAGAEYAPFQGYVEMPQTLAPMIMGNMASENLRVLNERNSSKKGSVAPAGAGAGSSITGTLAPPTGQPRAPHLLAERYPQAQRAKVEHAYFEALRTYGELEKKFGIPPNDVAGAVAAFIAGNYMAWRDVDFPDADFPPLVAQMREVLALNPAFMRSSSAEKRDMYEQLATIGSFMAITRMALKKQPSEGRVAANFRSAAKANLEQFLKTDVDRISLTHSGLLLR